MKGEGEGEEYLQERVVQRASQFYVNIFRQVNDKDQMNGLLIYASKTCFTFFVLLLLNCIFYSNTYHHHHHHPFSLHALSTKRSANKDNVLFISFVPLIFFLPSTYCNQSRITQQIPFYIPREMFRIFASIFCSFKPFQILIGRKFYVLIRNHWCRMFLFL